MICRKKQKRKNVIGSRSFSDCKFMDGIFQITMHDPGNIADKFFRCNGHAFINPVKDKTGKGILLEGCDKADGLIGDDILSGCIFDNIQDQFVCPLGDDFFQIAVRSGMKGLQEKILFSVHQFTQILHAGSPVT